VTEKGILPPFNSIQGLGDTAAESIAEAAKDGEFFTIEELKMRAKVGNSLVDTLKGQGILKGIPETNQLTLFESMGF